MPLAFHGGIQEGCFCPFGLDVVGTQQILRHEGKDGDLPPAMGSLGLCVQRCRVEGASTTEERQTWL